MEPYKIQTGKPVVTATLPESSEKSLDVSIVFFLFKYVYIIVCLFRFVK